MPVYVDNHCNRIAGRVGKEWGMKSKKKGKKSVEKKVEKSRVGETVKSKSGKKFKVVKGKEGRSKELIDKAKARGPAPAPPGKKKEFDAKAYAAKQKARFGKPMTNEEFNAQFKSKAGDRNYAHEYSKGKDMSNMIGNIRGGPRRSKRNKKK